MQQARGNLAALIVRWPFLAGTAAALLGVGLGTVAATPWTTWQWGRGLGEETALASETNDFAPAEAVAPGSSIANFRLTDQDGHRVQLRENAGKLLVVSFVTTPCATVCVHVTEDLRKLQQALGERMGRDLLFLTIGLDPGLDTPAALRRFALAHGVDFGSWGFLSGTAEELEAVRRAFGLPLSLPREGSGNQDHSSHEIAHHEPSAHEFQHGAAVYLVDRHGVLLKRLSPELLTEAGLREIALALAYATGT